MLTTVLSPSLLTPLCADSCVVTRLTLLRGPCPCVSQHVHHTASTLDLTPLCTHTYPVNRSDTAARAMPPWTTIEADADVVCSLHQRLADVYPVNSIDVVLVGIFHQVCLL